MNTVSAADEPAEAGLVGPADAAKQRAVDLIGVEDFPAAREVVENALAASPNDSDLLWVLAEIEFADGMLLTGVQCLAKAADASGRDASAVSRQIRTLTEKSLFREALKVIDQTPEQLGDDPLVRSEIGDLYYILSCPAHAFLGYGKWSGFPRWRAISWLYSGGPFSFVRRRASAWEESELLSVLREPEREHDQLDTIVDLSENALFRLKMGMENSDYAWATQYEYWSLRFRWIIRLLPMSYFPTWILLYLIINRTSFLSAPPNVVLGVTVSTAIAVGFPIFFIHTQIRTNLSVRRNFLRFTLKWLLFVSVIAILSETAVAEGYSRHVLSTRGWSAWIVFGWVILPATFASMFASGMIMSQVGGRALNNVWRKHCPILLMDLLLYVRKILQSEENQFDLAQRMALSRSLEFCASRFSQDLLPPAFLDDISSGNWFRRRTAGWAEAVRHMQYEVVMSVPGSRSKLEAQLRHEINCLATGNLGALAWRQPPASPSRRNTLKRRTVGVLRTILVAALPLGAVLTSQAVLHLNAGVFRWALITTGIWALLYVIISLDPEIGAKIETARTLTETLNAAKRGNLSLARLTNMSIAKRIPGNY